MTGVDLILMSERTITNGRDPLFDLLFDEADQNYHSANSKRYGVERESPALSTPFIAEFDEARLKGQMARVFACMRDGKWRTLSVITDACKPGGEASISAQLRSLRRKENGGHIVERRRKGDPRSGLFEYKLIVRGAK